MGFEKVWHAFDSRRGGNAHPTSAKNVAASIPHSSETTEALLPASSSNSNIDRSVLRKLNLRVLPFVLLIVMISYMDRGNLGFVAADVCTELHLNHARYGIGVGLFGFGYLISQIPSNFLIRHFGATLWFALLMVSWGVVAALFSLVQNRYEFYALRFLLGVAEGGTFPGVWYFLTKFYPEGYLTFPYAAIEGSVAISTPLASPLAAGLLSLDGLFGIKGWRLLFFVEGVIPILYGGVLYWILPSSIDNTSFLEDDEKEWIKAHDMHDVQERHLLRELNTVVRNKYFWFISVCAIIRGMLLTAAFYWTTLIIDDMLNGDDNDEEDDDTCASSKSTDIASVALTAIPFIICSASSFAFGRIASKVRNRTRVGGCIVACSGVFLVGWVALRHVSFVGALLSLSLGISCFIAPNAFLVGLAGSYFDKETKATSIALLNTLAGAGMAVGPICIGLLVDSHGYSVTVAVLAISSVVGGMALLSAVDPLLDRKPIQVHVNSN